MLPLDPLGPSPTFFDNRMSFTLVNSGNLLLLLIEIINQIGNILQIIEWLPSTLVVRIPLPLDLILQLT